MAPSKFERQIWPAVVAHRGASATHPENTIESFLAAASAGADMVEFDVRMTADQVPVVIHDAEVSRTTGGSGLVHQMTFEEIKQLDASAGRGPRTEIPSLQEVLEALSGRVSADIEIKNLPGEPSFDEGRESAVEETLKLVEATGFEGIVLISSFNWLSIERARELSPEIPTALITTRDVEPAAALEYVRTHHHDLLLPHVSAVTRGGKEFLRAAHADGIRVGTWTVDQPADLERCFAMGVDAVATNDPVTAVPIRDRFRSGRSKGPD